MNFLFKQAYIICILATLTANQVLADDKDDREYKVYKDDKEYKDYKENKDNKENKRVTLLLAQRSDNSSVKIIEPKKDVPVAKAAEIDDEKFELGLFTGFLAVDEFNTNPVLGTSFVYHLSPKIIFQLNYGESEVDRASFEDNAGGFSFLRDNERDFEYANLLAGFRMLRGRSFIGRNNKYNSDLYFMAGFGSVDFANGSNTSVVVGSSYRVVVTDAMTVNLDLRGHSVDRDFLGVTKSTFNTELALGINFLF
jgi:outer membrane beta-barrel protein